MKKKIVCLMLVLLILFNNLFVVLAQSSSSEYATRADVANFIASNFEFENIDYTKSEAIRVVLDGNQIQFDITPQIIDGRTLVPMRAIFESIGLTVDWDNLAQTATGSNAENSIIFTIGRNKAIVNNEEKILDVPASIINGRTMVPLRFLSENMGYNVIWVGASNLILMSKNDVVEWRYEGFENVPPYKKYEVKYVNGTKTNETRYNGANHTFEVNKQGIGILSVDVGINFLGGASPTIIWRNNSGKDIKYVTFTAVPYNAVGDKMSCSISNKSTVLLELTGPIETFNNETNLWLSSFKYKDDIKTVDKDFSKDSLGYYVRNYQSGEDYYLTQSDYQYCFNISATWDPAWYNNTISTAKITSVEVEYMDGTIEIISNPTIWSTKL